MKKMREMIKIQIKNKTKFDIEIEIDKNKKTIIKSNSKNNVQIDDEIGENEIEIKFKKQLGFNKIKKYSYDLSAKNTIYIENKKNISIKL